MGPGLPYGLHEAPAVWTRRVQARAGVIQEEKVQAIVVAAVAAETCGQAIIKVTVTAADGTKITCWLAADGTVTATWGSQD